ncbi:hypothetical protein ACE14D_22030, partial [Streptomyces sp. Act-28]
FFVKIHPAYDINRVVSGARSCVNHPATARRGGSTVMCATRGGQGDRAVACGRTLASVPGTGETRRRGGQGDTDDGEARHRPQHVPLQHG